MSLCGRFVCFILTQNLRIEPAKVAYLPTVDMHVDTVEAMSEVASILHKEYIATTGASHLIIDGDAKPYLHLKELCTPLTD